MKKLHAAVVFQGQAFAGCDNRERRLALAGRPEDVTCARCRTYQKRIAARARRKLTRVVR